MDLPENTSVPLTDLLDTRDAFRGYLAGTNRSDDRVGLTTLREPSAYAPATVEAFGQSWWGRFTDQGTVESLDPDETRRILRMPARTSVLVTADAPVGTERIAAVAGRERRRRGAALRALLDVAHIVFFPEPAHDGHDWSFFSAVPMRDRLVATFSNYPVEETRRFVIPYQKARSESKFYFETWQLTQSALPDYIEEV